MQRMCELCRVERTIVHHLSEGENRSCEWIPDPARGDVDPDLVESCTNKALYLVCEEFIDEHLCAEHAAREETELKEDLGAFLEEVGLDQGRLLPIQRGGNCEYSDLFNTEPCPKRAVYARRVRAEFAFCHQHAEEEGYIDHAGGILYPTEESELPDNWDEADPEESISLCSWCHRRIGENQEVFCLNARFRGDFKIRPSEMRVVKIPLATAGRTVTATIPSADSDARKEGVDSLFVTCSETCGYALKKALDRESSLFSAVLRSSEDKRP